MLKDIPPERLAQAYLRLMQCEWDDLVGKKPLGFDDMPLIGESRLFRKSKPGRFDYTYPASEMIKEILGPAQLSQLLWTINHGHAGKEWLQWYISVGIRNYQLKHNISTR